MMSHDVSSQQQKRACREIAGDPDLTASEAAVALFKQYARERPEVVALWTFGIGFVLGWKLKPW